MKKLLQIGLLLLLATPVVAQESSRPNPPKVLHTYDWKDSAQLSSGLIISNKVVQQRQLIGEEIISMEGMSVLKIENTNEVPLVTSLLTVTNSSVIKKTYWISFDMKIEHLERDFYNHYLVTCEIPPSALGGDERTNTVAFEIPAGTSNWKRYEVNLDRAEFEGLPQQLEVKITLGGHGTVYLRPIKLLGYAESPNWWMPEQSGIVGGIGGLVIGCCGALVGVLASRGKARKFVLALTKIFIVLGIFLLIAGTVAAATKQPYAIYYPLLLAGFILTIVFSVNLPSIQRRYDELEIRRMTSIDASGS